MQIWKLIDLHIGRNRIVDFEDDIINKITVDLITNTGRIANHLCFFQSSVWHEIHNAYHYPYHLQSLQNLHEGYNIARQHFYCWWLNSIGNTSDFLQHILWYGVPQFTRNVMNNWRNLHTWALETMHRSCLPKRLTYESVASNNVCRFPILLITTVIASKLSTPIYCNQIR